MSKEKIQQIVFFLILKLKNKNQIFNIENFFYFNKIILKKFELTYNLLRIL